MISEFRGFSIPLHKQYVAIKPQDGTHTYRVQLLSPVVYFRPSKGSENTQRFPTKFYATSFLGNAGNIKLRPSELPDAFGYTKLPLNYPVHEIMIPVGNPSHGEWIRGVTVCVYLCLTAFILISLWKVKR
jgi:hypothetical protein